MTLALALARALNCPQSEPPCGQCSQCQRITSSNHADVQVIGLDSDDGLREGGGRTLISVEQIRQVQHSASLAPYEGKYRLFIIEEAERLSSGAANCLLKTLEEPPSQVVFVLLAQDERLLPATVVSRCQCLKLHPVAKDKIVTVLTKGGVESHNAELIAQLSHGRIGWALEALQNDKLIEERRVRLMSILDIISGDYEIRFDYAARLSSYFAKKRGLVWEELDLWLDLWRDLLLSKLELRQYIINMDIESILSEIVDGFSLRQIRDFIDDLAKAGQQLRLNANPRLVLEVMMLDMPVKRMSKVAKYA
jgi:DNA polymerase-3 subunit delta'